MTSSNTYLSTHNVDRIVPSRSHGLGAPLILTMQNNGTSTQVSIFFRNGDAALTDRLVEAIEAAQGKPPVDPPHSHDEAAAYHAQISLFEGSKP